MTLIKIDKKTIRKNPNAGRTEFWASGKLQASIHVSFVCPPSKSQEKINTLEQLLTEAGCLCILLNTEPGDEETVVKIKALATSHSNVDDLVDLVEEKLTSDGDLWKIGLLQTSCKRDAQRIRLAMPESPFLFEMEDPTLECCHCKGHFRHSELLEDFDDSDDEIFSDRVCPLCVEWDCCKLEFERLTPEMTKHLE